MKALTSTVDQTGAIAAGDNVGNDKYDIKNNHLHYTPPSLGAVERLMASLSNEMANDILARDRLESFQFYFEKYAIDGVAGLEEKLITADRSDQIARAVRAKDAFVRLMTRYSYFSSAQAIFAKLLSIADDEFQCHIEPQLGKLSKQEIDVLIQQRIVIPISDEVGAGVFQIDRMLARGLVYWLAEQCYIRWHP